MVIWGRDYPFYLAAIEKETSWKHKPIGPLGAYLTLTDSNWGRAVETCLVSQFWSQPWHNCDECYLRSLTLRCWLQHNVLGAFLVDNKEDAETLLKIFRSKGGQQPTVHRTHFSSERPRADHVPSKTGVVRCPCPPSCYLP